MGRRNNQNNQYNGNQYNGNYYNGNNQYYNQNGQYYNNQNGQYYNQNGQYYNQNGQYYNQNTQGNKFGLYGQQNQQPKKKMDKSLLIKIGAFVGFALLLILIVFGINSCGKKEDKGPDYNDDVKVVGQETLGYVSIPSDWVNFQNQSPTRGIQFSDVNGTYIVTLESLPATQITSKEYALGIANSLEQSGVTVQGSEVKLKDYNAYQVYGQASNGTWVLVYFFEAEDGYVHSVGVEGPDKTNEAFKIPETFKVKKES